MIHRKAKMDDLPHIISLLSNDPLGKTRESVSNNIDPHYIKAFEQIECDPNQYLMVVVSDEKLVGTCHLTLMPSLTFSGSLRLNIEGVRVDEKERGKKIGEWMINQAVAYGKENSAKIIQLSTNKVREDAYRFYERLGFKATHEGMKLYL